MRRISLLDCTLRDGGYVNDWAFGKEVIEKVVRKVIQAGVEIIECGYLSTEFAGSSELARYDSIEDVKRAYGKAKSEWQSYAVMVNYGEYPVQYLTQAGKDSPVIRVAFHKKDFKGAFSYCRELKKKGYRFYIQPMGAQNYSDQEFTDLICETNKIGADAFYIVDSFGVMELKEFEHLLFLTDKLLADKIELGYHSHNNLQQAYSNSKFMVEQKLRHNIIIDASVFGMGRGAGNLNIELFAKYLNQNEDKNYNIEPFLEVFDECLKPIFAKNFWGYSLPFYLSSLHNCHPSYAALFAEKNTLSVKSMHELLAMISEEDKVSFSIEKASGYYRSYQENWFDDRAEIETLQKKVAGRNVLILAPGKSLRDYEKPIQEYIDRKQTVVFGVSRVSKAFSYEYLFLVNEKRKLGEKPENVKTIITTSNLHGIESELQVNYSSYLCNDIRVSDDPTLMLINVLIAAGVREIAVAGFDGFSANPGDNYFVSNLSLGTKLSTKMQKNSAIREQIAKLKKQIELVFLTPSRYVSP
ncbi:MAG: aldolase catalytic domain-containing protein [Lachnospiraceae bacterium]|nr:aldolase catalytic domain-containing protein [Lachnospiraceae bacterium]